MRYLRQQVLNRRAPYDRRLQVDANNSVIMSTPAALQLPAGTSSEQPITSKRYGTSVAADLSGMIRYNTETDQFEGYQAGTWRSFKFKESSTITKQTFGPGDYVETIFGKLDPAPPTVTADNVAWNGDRLIVLVENVYQIFNTNYSIINNPARVTSDKITFTRTTKTIATSDNSIDFAAKKYRSGMSITISGTNNNNGTYTIDTVSATEIVLTTMFPADESLSTATVAGPYEAGYFILFDSAVPLGKSVTVLHGFDS